MQELSPESPEQRQELIVGLRAVIAALKLGGKVGPLTIGLASEVKSLHSGLAQKGHPLKIESKRATYSRETSSELYFVDSKIRAYVVIERALDGLFISVFPAPATS